MMNVEVSFIIPVYNIEKYVGKCLKELKKIKGKNVEFIVVNDGSTDNSRRICETTIDDDSRFILINKPNGGLSSARNEGIKVARGKWICFWDGDDWIEKRFINNFEKLLDKDVDVICFGALKVKDENDKQINRLHYLNDIEGNLLTKQNLIDIKHGILNVDNKNFKKISGQYLYYLCAWGKLIKSSIIHKYDLIFNEKIKWAEDLDWTYRLFCSVKKVKVFDYPVYMYRQQSMSIMHSFVPNKRYQILDTIQNFILMTELNQNFFAEQNELHLLAVKQFLYALKLDMCNSLNRQSYFKRKTNFLEFRSINVFDQSFKQVKLNEFRNSVFILSLFAKYRLFWIIDLIMNVKQKIEK